MATKDGQGTSPKVEWKKIGNALCYDTKASGAKRTTKSGTVFHMGKGTVTVNGVTIEVMVTVMPSRPGSVAVFIEQPPDNG